MKKTLRDNGLSLALFALFLIMLAGQSMAGWLHENDERMERHEPALSFSQYLRSGSFLEVTMENWESEFLQMSVYIVFTIFLYQRGSSESKSPDEVAEVDRDPRLSTHKSDVPVAVKRGGWYLRIYENSLSLAFVLLFMMSFFLHAVGGMRDVNEKNLMHGAPPISLLSYLSSARFWFESLQNWQSEFLAIWSMVVLSIFLRQRGSPESKPVDSPHSETGS